MFGVRTPPQGLSCRNHCVQLERLAHRDDLPSILGHLLEHERHLLVAQVTPPQILLGQRGKKLSVAAGEADAVVVAGRLGDLLIAGLILLINPNQTLDRPDLAGGELVLDEEDRGLFGGGVHRADTLPQIYKNSSTIFSLCPTS